MRLYRAAFSHSLDPELTLAAQLFCVAKSSQGDDGPFDLYVVMNGAVIAPAPAFHRAHTRSGHHGLHLVGFEVISAFNLLRIVWPNELKLSATITKAPGPPITLLR